MLPSETFPVLTPKLANVVMALSDESIPVTLVLGESGVGKTFAVNAALDALMSAHLAVEARRRMSARALAEALLREATNNPLLSLGGRILTRDQLADVIADELPEDDTLIVIDNAHVLSVAALTWLARLHARGGARLVLIGSPTLIERLPDELCAIACSIRFEPISEEMTPWLVRQLHPIYICAQRAAIVEVNRGYCEGSLARWALFTDHAAAVCSAERIPYLNDYVVRTVLHHFRELDEAA